MSLPISHRANNLIASPIRKFLPLVRQAEQAGVKFYKMNVGDPDIAPPSSIFQGFITVGHNRHLPYAPSPGIPEHVSAWLAYYRRFGLTLAPENILPIVGAAEGILMAMLALCDPGDELIVFEPLYTSYKGFAAVANIKLVPITLELKNNFRLPPLATIEKKITARTRAIVIINPDNPTGKVWSRAELTAVLKIAREHNLYVVSDETYREIVFHGEPGSLLNYPGSHDRVIVLDSLSKRFSVPGLRIGALVSFNGAIMSALLKLAMIRLSVPTAGQLATIEILKKSTVYTNWLRREYERRRDTVLKELARIPGLVFNHPAGAFYQVVKLPLARSEEFVKFLITDFRYHNETALVTPMADFYITPGLGLDEVRIAYVLNSRDLKKGMMIIRKGLEKYLEL